MTETASGDAVVFRWWTDGDGTGKLTVTASSNGFAGSAAAWFSTETILDFALAIDAYPLPDARPTLSSGFGVTPDYATAQEHVGLAVYKVGSRGQVAMHVHLATESWPDTRPESVHDVRLEHLTTYDALRRLSRDLPALVDGRIDGATIEADPFDVRP